MEYLVESHLGGYYITDMDPKKITAYCEQCGNSDTIILSFEKGKKFDSLKNYFSKIKKSEEFIRDNYEIGMSKNEILDYLMYDYEEDKQMIQNLFEDEHISLEERKNLLSEVRLTQRRQLEVLKKIYSKKKVLKKER